MGRWKKIAILLGGLGLGTAVAVHQARNDLDFFEKSYKALQPVLFGATSEDAEGAHRFAVLAAKYGIVPIQSYPDPEILQMTVLGKRFTNPIGLAAGFDKHAEAISGMLSTGLAFVEIGSVTPMPQEGNPRPRVFRLPEDRAVINRYGFNSEGIEKVRERLELYRWHSSAQQGFVGVNLGKNKTSEGHGDYVLGLKALSPYADYVVVNVSSPNTVGLRSLQRREQLHQLISAVIEERNTLIPNLQRKVPVLVKIAPDLTTDELKDIAEVALQTKVDGVIISNTTLARPNTLQSKHASQTGGLSGQPLFERSTQVLSDFYSLTNGSVPLIGVGGVSNGKDAYEKIKAGASLVQLYSAFIYEGPGLTRRIKRELAEILQKDGYTSVSQAVGAVHRQKEKKPTSTVAAQSLPQPQPVPLTKFPALLDILFN